MLRLSKLLLTPAFLIGIAAGCATAPPGPAYTPEQIRIEKLLSQVHLPQYAAALQRASLRVAGHPWDRGLPEDQRLRHRLEVELEPDAVVSDVVRSVSQSYDAAAVAQLEQFWASPLGRRVHLDSDAPYSFFTWLGYRIFGGPNYVLPERAALAEKLEDLTGSRDTTTDLYMRIYASIVGWYQVREFVDPAEVKAVGGIEGLIGRERERVETIGALHAVPYTLYAFSGLPTPQLAEYVAQVESPAGRWFTKAAREGLTQSIQRRCQAISR